MSAVRNSVVRLSPNESRILSLLPEGGERVTTAWLAHKFYGRSIPFHGRTIVAGLVRSLELKTKVMKGEQRVKRSKRAGPHPIEVWVERRP